VSASDAEGSDAASDASSSDCSDDDDCDRGPQEEEEEEEEDEEGEELTTQGARRSTEEEVVNARRSNDRRSRDEGIRDGDLEHAGEGMQVGDEDSERAGANTAWSKADKVKGRDKRRRRRKKASEPWVAATTATTSSRRKGRRKVGFVPSWVRTTAAATECWRDWDIDESACMSNQEAKALRALRGQENEFDDELTHLRYCSAYEVAQFFGGDADAISIFHTPPEASMDDPKTRPKVIVTLSLPPIWLCAARHWFHAVYFGLTHGMAPGADRTLPAPARTNDAGADEDAEAGNLQQDEAADFADGPFGAGLSAAVLAGSRTVVHAPPRARPPNGGGDGCRRRRGRVGASGPCTGAGRPQGRQRRRDGGGVGAAVGRRGGGREHT
jgi:hypothetical protein